METGTFQTASVEEVVNTYFVPLKYESGKSAEQFMRFSVKATPTYVVLDADGNEIYRTIGYYEADDFISQLKIARAKVA
jgi:thioredoxin-related protein